MLKQTEKMRILPWRQTAVALLSAAILFSPVAVHADTLKVLTAGAFKQVLLGIVPEFEKQGHSIQFEADTAGGLIKRVEQGESFDLLIAPSAALETLRSGTKISNAHFDLARVGVGVAVKEGTTKPDIRTVDGFKHALLSAKGVAYIDPASGGTSGIYISNLIDKLGIGPEIRSKSFLVKGGYSADRILSGEADIAIQQISEILPVKGVELVGPLPTEIQSYTVYSAAVAAAAKQPEAAKALIDLIQSKQGAGFITSKGMEPAS